MQFREQVVVVTGAAAGMGRELSLRASRQGARVGLIDRDVTGLQQLQNELTSAGVRCCAAVADLRCRDEARAAIDRVVERLGAVDVLIASAGVCGVSSVDDLCVSDVERMMQINFLGVVYTIEAVLGEMLQRGSGHIVGISSLAAFRGLPYESGYCASKAALSAYLESLRPALRKRGVVVTTVFPGFVRTGLLAGVLADTGAAPPPGVVSVEKAAEQILSAIRRRSRVHCFPLSTTLLAHISRSLPAGIYDWVMGRVAARNPMTPRTAVPEVEALSASDPSELVQAARTPSVFIQR